MMKRMNLLRRLVRRVWQAVALLALAAVACFCMAGQNEIAFPRNLLLYRLETLWPHPLPVLGAPGALAGLVTDEQGLPLSGATVVAAAPGAIPPALFSRV